MPRTKVSGSVFDQLDDLDNSFGAWSQIDQLWLVGKARELAAERDALREALSAVIDEGVVNWHDASDDTRHVHEALGLTFEQYAAWVERDWSKFVKACPE